jgi:hypothetical protein
MPIMIRGYVDEQTWLVLAELCYFFHQLCAKELDREVVKKLGKQAPELLCKLEMLLPPGFFNPMHGRLLLGAQASFRLLPGAVCCFTSP